MGIINSIDSSFQDEVESDVSSIRCSCLTGRLDNHYQDAATLVCKPLLRNRNAPSPSGITLEVVPRREEPSRAYFPCAKLKVMRKVNRQLLLMPYLPHYSAS